MPHPEGTRLQHLAGARRGARVGPWRHLPSWRPLTLLLLAGLLLAACSGDEEVRNASGTVVNAGTWSVFDLREGDCLLPDPELTGEVADVPVVPCEEAHTQEVFATVEHPAAAYPGAGAVSIWADGACLGELEASLDLTLDDGVFVSYLLPTFDGWNKNDDRRVVCVLVFPDVDEAVGSVVAGTADITRVEPAPPDLPGADATATPSEAAPTEAAPTEEETG